MYGVEGVWQAPIKRVTRKINLKKIKKVIGIDTNSAVRSGFFWGYAGLIDNIINLIKKETGKSYKVVITGGFSDLFKNSIKTKVIENKNITVKGLIKISKLLNRWKKNYYFVH